MASEVAMASEATKRRNMHIDARVLEVADFKFDVISDLRGSYSDTVSSLLRHCPLFPILLL